MVLDGGGIAAGPAGDDELLDVEGERALAGYRNCSVGIAATCYGEEGRSHRPDDVLPEFVDVFADGLRHRAAK